MKAADGKETVPITIQKTESVGCFYITNRQAERLNVFI